MSAPSQNVGSRFVTQAQLTEAQKQREQHLREAYERCVHANE